MPVGVATCGKEQERPRSGHLGARKRQAQPRLDDQLDHETRSLQQGAPVESRVEEHRERGPGDGQPTPKARLAGGRATAASLDLDDAEARGDIARFLTPSAFPADREALLADAEGNNATAEVLERLQALPEVAPTRTSRTSGAPSAARSSTASDRRPTWPWRVRAAGAHRRRRDPARGATLEAVFEHATEGLAEVMGAFRPGTQGEGGGGGRGGAAPGAAGRLAERGAVAARGARRAGRCRGRAS